MPITLGTNIQSLNAQRLLGRTEEKLSTVFERLSSGQRINRASDDAAGLAISESLNVDRRVYNQAVRNLNDGLSVLNIADSTVEQLSSIVTRIQELAQQAANGSLSSTQRESLNSEAQELRDEFFRVSRSADFNGLRLFDGSINGLRLQGGYGEDGSIFSSLGGELADGTFKTGVDVSGGLGTTFGSIYQDSIETADIDGDGNQDFVAAGYLLGTIDIRFGTGDGETFESVVIPTELFYSIEVSDLNGDGISEVIGANDDGEIFVYSIDQDRSITSEATFSFGASDKMVAVESEDFNGDGLRDLIVLNEVSEIDVFLNNGGGSFSPGQSINYSNDSYSLTLGDFNGDSMIFPRKSGHTIS